MSAAGALPDRIGSLLFCTCGNLLDLPSSEDFILCEQCGKQAAASLYENQPITTSSNPAAFPSELRQKRSLVQTTSAEGEEAGLKKATIREPCPKCSQQEVNFYTMQLRSADEGSTVFYDCPKCGHRWNEDN